ncbi:MAG TPA: hypothetical protein VG273_07890 [Bryobacteraceae bacterium]|jgi:hypothetical protein|nr:hypothetical protein [Bryobacteraceae bacterium]
MTESLNTLAAKILTVVSFALVLSTAASAQTSNILMLPNADQTCETTQACAAYMPGSEPFVLLIKATKTNTASYRYTVVATLEDGSKRVISGQIGRSDDGAGYTAAPVSLGCDPVSVDTTVVEAGV